MIIISNIILGLLIFVFFINPIFGIIIWSICDDKDKTLQKWMDSCPKDIEWFMIPLTYSAWPIAVKWCMENKK
jgi:hypothetical protein